MWKTHHVDHKGRSFNLLHRIDLCENKREPITPLSAQFTALHQDEGLGSGTTWSSLNGVSTLVQKMETTSGQVLSRARAFLVRRPLDPAQQFQEGSG